ncbi:MAG: biotin-dependent carboxyltransferase family protein [Planctomycetia bacterium]
MATLLVLEPGLCTSVQDLGRPGLAALGVARAGAADTLSLRVANRLVGNPDGAAALELTLTGGRYRIEQGARVALAGAPMEARLHVQGAAPRLLEPLAAHDLPHGSELEVGPARVGARACLSVAGGIRAPAVLGSRSAHLPSGLGGHALAAGARLELSAPPGGRPGPALAAPAQAELLAWLLAPHVHATDGAHAALFEPAARERFWAGAWRVGSQGNRMGVRMRGPDVAPPGDGRLPTEGMPVGAVQVPRAGEAIVLLCDAPPTGGYPMLACLAAVDLPRAAQWRPGEQVRLVRITPQQARAASEARAARLDALLAPVAGADAGARAGAAP